MDNDVREALKGLYAEIANLQLEAAASNTLLSSAVTLAMKSSPDPQLYLSALQGFADSNNPNITGEIARAAYQAKLDVRLSALAAAIS